MIQPAGCWNSVKGTPHKSWVCTTWVPRGRTESYDLSISDNEVWLLDVPRSLQDATGISWYIPQWYRLCIPYSIYFRIVIYKDISLLYGYTYIWFDHNISPWAMCGIACALFAQPGPFQHSAISGSWTPVQTSGGWCSDGAFEHAFTVRPCASCSYWASTIWEYHGQCHGDSAFFCEPFHGVGTP